MTTAHDQLVHLLKQALIELAELRASIEYDEEFMEGIPAVIVPLEKDLTQLLGEIETSRHVFVHKDLPFMALVSRVNKIYLPFKQLFIDINKLYKSLTTGGDDQ